MRLFIGVPVPGGPVYGRVASDLPLDARPVPPGTWHVTLRFLGEVFDPAAVADALQGAVRGRPRLPCVVEGLGAFPDAKRARVVWAGVRAPGIEGLAEAVESATAKFGEPPERRRFVAHATLARIRAPADLRSLVARHAGTRFAEGVLDRVVLYRSVTGPGGASYERLHEAPLGGEA